MYANRMKKNPYTKQTIFDVLSAVTGVLVIAVGIFSFWNPEKYSWLFPVVFVLAAVFQCLLAVPRLSGGYGRKSGRKKALGICLFIMAGLLLVLAAVSAICLWR